MKYSRFSDFLKRTKVRSEFVNHVLALMTGAIIAQIISFLISPLLTRLYSPQEFGIFSLYISIANVFGVVVTGRYHLAIMLPKKDEEAINIAALCMIIVFCVTLFLILLLFFQRDLIFWFFDIYLVNPIILIFPMAIFFIGMSQIQMAWLNRKKNYKIISWGKINQSGLNASSSLICGMSGLGVMGLMLGDLFGVIASVISGFALAVKDINILKKNISLQLMKRMGKKYAIFPTINMLHALGDMAQASGVVFIISTGFGAEVLGFYAFGLRVLRAPMGIIGNSISQVFYQKMIFVYNNKQSLKPMLRSILKKLFILALPPFLIIFTFSDYLFKVVFGDNWAEAGVYVQILCPWLYFNFVASSVSQIPMIVGKQREVFLISLMGNSIMLLMYVVGAYYGFNIKMVLAFVSLYMSIYTVLVILWTLKISDENF